MKMRVEVPTGEIERTFKFPQGVKFEFVRPGDASPYGYRLRVHFLDSVLQHNTLNVWYCESYEVFIFHCFESRHIADYQLGRANAGADQTPALVTVQASYFTSCLS